MRLAMNSAAMAFIVLPVILVVAITAVVAEAAPPNSNAIVGIRMDSSYGDFKKALVATYPKCRVEGGWRGALIVDEVRDCESSQSLPGHVAFSGSGSGVADSLLGGAEKVDGEYKVVVIELARWYPVPAPKTKPAYTLREVLASLRSQYGEPDDDKRKVEPTESFRDDIARLTQWVDHSLQWGPRGTFENGWCRSSEGPLWLSANIRAASSPETVPANEPFVISIRLEMCHTGRPALTPTPSSPPAKHLEPTKF